MRAKQIGLSLAVVLVLAVSFVAYRIIWGTPFSFTHLMTRQAIEMIADSPQALTSVGLFDGAWYDLTSNKLDPYSLADREKRFARVRRLDAELTGWDRSRLSHQEQLSYDILHWSYGRMLADANYPWLGANNKPYPVEQAFGFQKNIINFLLSTHQIKNARLARHYVERVKAVGPLIDAVRADVERQAKLGVVAPDFIIDRSVAQMQALIAPAPKDNALVKTLAEKSKAIDLDAAERQKLIDDTTATVAQSVYPAYRRLIAEEKALRPHAIHDAGIWRLKGGSAYYVDQLKLLTTTDMTPDEIHAYGLSEVARISAEEDSILKSVGLTQGSIAERMAKLQAAPRFLYANTDAGRAAQLAHYREILTAMRLQLPKVFAHLPAIPLKVERVPVFAEKGSAGAYYERPSLDGKRPGIFFANERNPSAVPMWAMRTLAYHEGIPGHHLQIATVTEMTILPFQRRMGGNSAFAEGWALYAEHLAKEMGVYDNDPYGDLGHLQAEMFRAVRLVVDTGMHAKHWSREQAIAYMVEKTAMNEEEVTAEIERYVVCRAKLAPTRSA